VCCVASLLVLEWHVHVGRPFLHFSLLVLERVGGGHARLCLLILPQESATFCENACGLWFFFYDLLLLVELLGVLALKIELKIPELAFAGKSGVYLRDNERLNVERPEPVLVGHLPVRLRKILDLTFLLNF